MTSKHLQYETSKTVIQYLDANLRFKLAQKAPTLRSIEKIVPLQIRNLVIGDANFVINGTKYTFRVHRESLDGSNLVSKPGCDYDEYGFPMYPGRINVLPGDIDLREDRGLSWQWKNDTDEYEMNLKLKLRNLTVQPQKNHRQLHVSAIRRPRKFFNQDQRHQRAIDDCRARLAPFETRRNKTPLPYIPSLQLTVESPDGKKHIQRAPYTSMLYEIMKKLSTDFFGSRGSLVQVENLVISAKDGIIRFPVGLKFDVRNLKIDINSSPFFNVLNYSRLSPIIIHPLKTLEILEVTNDFENLEHKIVKEARQLIVATFWEHERWLDTWKRLKNQKVHLKSDIYGYPTDDFNELIDHWILEGKSVRSCYKFDLHSDKIRDILRKVKKRPEVIERSKSSIVLAMKNDYKLVVSSEIPQYDWKGVLKFKVVRSRQ